MKQIGGIPLDSIATEFTYGLERLAMHIQKKDNLFDLEWNKDGLTYRDVFYEEEVEYSRFFQEEASIEEYNNRYNKYLDEAKNLSTKKLHTPAYDSALKASHSLNILDARGAISATQRHKMLLQVREAVKQICEGITNSPIQT
jgi:glycyl-tRNA synthetase alpha subunit